MIYGLKTDGTSTTTNSIQSETLLSIIRLPGLKSQFLKKNNILVIPPKCEKWNISLFVRDNVILVDSSCTTTNKNLRNRVTTGIMKDACIYSFPCNSCNLQYIGESDCLERRFQQYKSNLQYCSGNSALVKHRDNTGHANSIKNSFISRHVNNKNQRELIESFLIKNIDNNMNVYEASIAIDDFTSSIQQSSYYICSKFVWQ